MKIENKKQPLLPWAIFLPSLGIVLIVSTTIVFPTILIRSLSGNQDFANINSFETGIWAYPFLVTNFILIAAGILYYTNKIPQSIKKSIKAIFDFEVSKEVAFLIVTALIGLYSIITASTLFTEEPWGDYQKAKLTIEQWRPTDISHVFLQFSLFLLYMSMKIFGNYKVIPFLSSMALLVLTYLITSKISQKRFAGIISMVILLQSGIFRNYATSEAYTDFWVLFYVLSLYLILNKWHVSPISFILSMASKAISAIFVPMTFFFIYRSQIPKKKKILLSIAYVIIIVLGIVIFLAHPELVGPRSFNSSLFLGSFNAISYQLRNDGLVVMFLPALIIGLFIASKRKVQYADSIMILIAGMILSQSFLAALTTNFSEIYRFMSLIVFFAIGVGILLSKKFSQQA